MDYPNYEAGFFFTPVVHGQLHGVYVCYVVHKTMKYQSGLAYPSHRLARFDKLGESYMVVIARNRRVAKRKVRRELRKYRRKNIL